MYHFNGALDCWKYVRMMNMGGFLFKTTYKKQEKCFVELSGRSDHTSKRLMPEPVSDD